MLAEEARGVELLGKRDDVAVEQGPRVAEVLRSAEVDVGVAGRARVARGIARRVFPATSARVFGRPVRVRAGVRSRVGPPPPASDAVCVDVSPPLDVPPPPVPGPSMPDVAVISSPPQPPTLAASSATPNTADSFVPRSNQRFRLIAFLRAATPQRPWPPKLQLSGQSREGRDREKGGSREMWQSSTARRLATAAGPRCLARAPRCTRCLSP